MSTFQVSVFVENKPGRLADITEALAKAEINMRALCVADTSDFGILRLIADDPHEAEKTLTEKGFTVSLTNVLCVRVPDTPGGLTPALRLLSDNGISVEYMYAFISRDHAKACVVLRVEDDERAAALLEKNGIGILNGDFFDA